MSTPTTTFDIDAAEARIAALRQRLVLAEQQDMPSTSRTGINYKLLFVIALQVVVVIVFCGPYIQLKWEEMSVQWRKEREKKMVRQRAEREEMMIRKAVADEEERVKRQVEMEMKMREKQMEKKKSEKKNNKKKKKSGSKKQVVVEEGPIFKNQITWWLKDVFALICAYIWLFLSKIFRAALYCFGLWLSYRTFSYFRKEEYQRQDNGIDTLLGVVINFVISFVMILVLPLVTIFFGRRAFFGVGIGHDDAIEVCDLCGHGGPMCQSYTITQQDPNKIYLCAEHLRREESRLRKASADEVEEFLIRQMFLQARKGSASETEEEKEIEENVQKALAPASNWRSSPAPYHQPPPHLSAFDRGYSSSGAGGRYSGSLHRNPGMNYQQLSDYDAWNAVHNASLPPETQRILWLQSHAEKASTRGPTPSKRFL